MTATSGTPGDDALDFAAITARAEGTARYHADALRDARKIGFTLRSDDPHAVGAVLAGVDVPALVARMQRAAEAIRVGRIGDALRELGAEP